MPAPAQMMLYIDKSMPTSCVTQSSLGPDRGIIVLNGLSTHTSNNHRHIHFWRQSVPTPSKSAHAMHQKSSRPLESL